MPSNIFDYVNVGTKIYRSLYNLDYENILDCDFGKGVPVMARFALPGDIWKITNVGFFRTLPLFAPIFTGIKVKFRNFFVPLRLVDEDATDIISGGEDGNDTNFFQHIAGQPQKYGFHDYLGIPLNISPANGGANLPRRYWKQGYDLIYNEWYRDERLQEERPVINANFSDDLFNVNYSRDYFTSALLNQQLGVAPAIPLTGVLPLNYVLDPVGIPRSTSSPSGPKYYYAGGNNVYNTSSFGRAGNSSDDGFSVNAYEKLNVRANQLSGDDLSLSANYNSSGPTSISDSASLYVPGPALKMDGYNATQIVNGFQVNLASAGGQFDIQDIRRAFAFQSILERNNRAGSRYNEFLRANYGISPTDETLQRPVYLGGSQSYINISEVLQNSQTTDSSPLGTQAGKGIGLSSNSIKPYLVKEFGMMFTIMSITPDTQYMSQGVNRQYTYATRWDFFNPSLQNLGEQAIRNGELYINSDLSGNDAITDNEKIFGYQPMYQELRFNDNIICGAFRDTLKYWHLGREFSERPNLDSDFIQVDAARDNLNRIFAADDSSQYKPFYCHIYNKLRVVRPLVKYPIPATL